MTRSWIAILAIALMPCGLAAQGGQWPTLTGAGIEYLSETGFLQVSLSGQLDLEALQVGGDGWGGLVKHKSGTETAPTDWVACTFCHVNLEYNGRPGNVLAHRLRLFADIFVGDHVYALVEGRSDRGHGPGNRAIQARVEQAFLRLSTTSGAYGVQVGRFANPFGSYQLRHMTVVDPFLRPPLPYEYRTVLVRRHVVGSEDGVGSWKDWPVLFRSPGTPPVWDVPYQPGAMVFGSVGPIDVRVAAMSGAPSSDPADWGFDLDRFDSPSWVAAARTSLSPSMELGASYSRGPWMEPIFGGAVPAAGSYRDFDQELFSADLSYLRGPMMLRAEAILDLWQVPGVQDRLRDISYTAEVQWDVRPGLSAAARIGLIDFSRMDTGPGGVATDWDRDVYRVEGSLGYRLVRNAGVILSAYHQAVHGAAATQLGGVRLWYAF